MAEESTIPADPPNAPAAPKGPFSQVPIEVIISVGKAHPLVGDLLNLRGNSVLALDQKVSDPVELYVGNQLIARGTLEELDGSEDGQLAVRLTEVASNGDGLC